MLRKPAFFLAVAALMLPTSAHAAAPFQETVGAWSVYSLGRRCTMLNRDLEVFNIAPYNALGFSRVVGTQDTIPQLYVWPGAFTPDKAVTVSFTPQTGKPIFMKARTIDSFAVDTADPLTPADLERLAAPGLLIVRVSDVKQNLAFRADGLKEALDSLARCAKGQ